MELRYRDKVLSGGAGGSSTGGGDGNPIGTVISYLGTTPPTGYLLCDGTIYAISSYPALAAFIESEYGAKDHFGGDGVDTFAVPDLSGKFLLGKSANHAIGSTGGSETVTLTVEQMPKHQHGAVDKELPVLKAINATSGVNGITRGSSIQDYSAIGNTSYTGSSQPHPNMPPYFTATWLIKAE